MRFLKGVTNERSEMRALGAQHSESLCARGNRLRRRSVLITT